MQEFREIIPAAEPSVFGALVSRIRHYYYQRLPLRQSINNKMKQLEKEPIIPDVAQIVTLGILLLLTTATYCCCYYYY